ncbi:hypothetical protein DAI22_09g086901 [Oryza sativa Japonica Group]|nr:hypothetical protein DAI22_09g086901 [Oryza sativa Japonica Group]
MQSRTPSTPSPPASRLACRVMNLLASPSPPLSNAEYHQETLEILKLAIKSTKKLWAVMLDTVGPELQVVNKSKASISLLFSPLTRGRRPPHMYCQLTSLGLLRL